MKHSQIKKSIRELVYKKYNGHCAYCGSNIEYKDMQVDHVDSLYLSYIHGVETDDTIDNYLPACRQCNYYKGGGSLECFRERLTTEMMHNLRNNFGYRLAIKYGLVSENSINIEFYFEKLNTKRL